MKNFGGIILLGILAVYCAGLYINRPLSLTDRHLPNEWMDFQKEWNQLAEADSWPYSFFYTDELEYVEKARELYAEWINPSEKKDMERIYHSYPALFPEIYNEYRDRVKNDGVFDMLSLDNPLIDIFESVRIKNMSKTEKEKYRKEFYDLNAVYQKKKNQTNREVFSRLLALRAEYAKGESLPPILNRERRKPDDSDKKEIDSNSPLRRKAIAIEPLKESEIFKYVPWPTES
jgi:hypothetical protein